MKSSESRPAVALQRAEGHRQRHLSERHERQLRAAPHLTRSEIDDLAGPDVDESLFRGDRHELALRERMLRLQEVGGQHRERNSVTGIEAVALQIELLRPVEVPEQIVARLAAAEQERQPRAVLPGPDELYLAAGADRPLRLHEIEHRIIALLHLLVGDPSVGESRRIAAQKSALITPVG